MQNASGVPEGELEQIDRELARLEGWAHKGHHAVEKGDFERAEELYGKIREHFPEMIDGPYLLAKLRVAQGRWAEAAEAYQEALRVIEADRDGFDNEVLEEMIAGRDEARARAGL